MRISRHAARSRRPYERAAGWEVAPDPDTEAALHRPIPDAADDAVVLVDDPVRLRGGRGFPFRDYDGPGVDDDARLRVPDVQQPQGFHEVAKAARRRDADDVHSQLLSSSLSIVSRRTLQLFRA